MGGAEPFVSAAEIAERPAALAERAEQDGYLYFPELLPPGPLHEVRREILSVCRAHGFLAPDSELEEGIAASDLLLREGDPAYLAAYDDIQQLEAFHRLAHQPELLAVLERLFGEEVLVHPRTIARVMFPRSEAFTTPAHQDYLHIRGTEETWTAWIPLGPCPRQLGGLEVLAGSHRQGLLPTFAAAGAGGAAVDPAPLGGTWHGGDFACGDVLLFHSLTVHRAVDNATGDRLRLSVDYRYQGVHQPIHESSLRPHFGRLSWAQVYAGWQSDEDQFFWQQWPLEITGASDPPATY